ncbi:MAG: diguanylate cyclase [Acidobacteria bacterium]|uniref:diguanylate cyclase n=1 Tax=Candidatus Polarisedimenticola svalbardensis TaxID=2886004 RepID=A0A8J6Y153_9BACT|nr:diguanylate cyclase [Candidatus Polarisedimenticola svalbardensis]
MAEHGKKGHVLVLCREDETASRLVRWIHGTGAEAVSVSGAESLLLGEGSDESIDLLVTDFDTDEPRARALLRRLATGDLFPDVPQLHLLRDIAFRTQLLAWNPELAAVSMVSPPEAGAFQARVRLAREVGRLRREVARSTVEDPMTGLYNRRYFMARLEQEFSRARRYRTPVSLVLIDIDHLRSINERFGHTAGDAAIRGVGDLLLRCVRKEDLVGRFGDECFGAVLPGTRHRGAAVLANKARTEAETLIIPGHGHELSLKLSAGISSWPGNARIKELEDLLNHAETALAEAKERGGNRIYIDEGVIRSDRRLVMVADPDRSLLNLAEDLLSVDDYRVVLAESGKSAMETLRFRVPDLLILDVQMMASDGTRSLLEEIQDLYPEKPFPVLGMSSTQDIEPVKLAELAVDRYITKPFSVPLLRNVARELVDR